MTISKETKAEILRLHMAENWSIGSIAQHLGVHHSVVKRVVRQYGLPLPEITKSSKLDLYLSFIKETLKKYPMLHASRLHKMCESRGYRGSESHFRRIVGRIRPKPQSEAYLRLRTLPGEQGQVDWGHFGHLEIGRAMRPLMAFVLVLSYSRRIFLRFFLSQKTEIFLLGHQEAFTRFAGVPRVILYDNLKSCVLERRGDAIRYHPLLLDFSTHYLFEARPVAVARGNEKGRVERAIRYVRSSFFAARPFRDLDDLNRQADEWCEGLTMDRPWPDDTGKTVREAFIEEKDKLLPLPDAPFPCHERVEVKVGKTPYVRFDKNDYSVPHKYARRSLCLIATLQAVRILDGDEVVAEHERSFSKGEQIEDPSHIEGLVAEKARARKHRGFDRLYQLAPSSQGFMEQLAKRGKNLGNSTARLLLLLDEYGGKELDLAIREVQDKGVAHVPSVALVLDQRRKDLGLLPKLPVQLPDDARIKDLVVKQHDLESYDQIAKTTIEEQETKESDDDNSNETL